MIEDFARVSSGSRIYTGIDDFLGREPDGPDDPGRAPAAPRSFARIGKYAVVGANCVVLPGVTLGEGCTVGALSLVNRDCEPWTIYGGAPGPAVKARRRDRIVELERAAPADASTIRGGRYIPRRGAERDRGIRAAGTA